MNCHVVPKETYDFLQFLRTTGSVAAHRILQDDIAVISFVFHEDPLYITPQPQGQMISISVSSNASSTLVANAVSVAVQSNNEKGPNRRERRAKGKRSEGSDCYWDPVRKELIPGLRIIKVSRQNREHCGPGPP